MRLLTVVDRSDVVSESVDALDQFARPSNIQMEPTRRCPM